MQPRGSLSSTALESSFAYINTTTITAKIAICANRNVHIKPEHTTTDLLGSTANTAVTKEHILVGGEDFKAMQASSQYIRRARGGTAVIKERGKEGREGDALHATRVAVKEGTLTVVVSHYSKPPSYSLSTLLGDPRSRCHAHPASNFDQDFISVSIVL